MNDKRIFGAVLLFCVACQGEVVTFQEEQGLLASAATGGGGTASGTGGSGAHVGGLAGYGGNSNSECSGPATHAAPDLSFGGYQSGGGYQPGCYGGGSAVEGPHGEYLLGSTIRACELEREEPVGLFSEHEYECCRAGSIAAPLCEVDADCPQMAGAPEPSCIQLNGGWANACVVRCESDAECPSNMICGRDYMHGRMCMFADTVWFPGCTENYCLDSAASPYYLKGQDVRCGESVPCCAGLVCSSDGRCL